MKKMALLALTVAAVAARSSDNVQNQDLGNLLLAGSLVSLASSLT